MEKIHKTINLNDLRNRDLNYTPYIRYGSDSGEIVYPSKIGDNYGGFCCNVIVDGNVVCYLDEVKGEHLRKKHIYDGVFLKRVGRKTSDCENGITKEYDSDVYSVCTKNDWPESINDFELSLDYTFSKISPDLYLNKSGNILGDYVVLVDEIVETLYDDISGRTDYAYAVPEITIPLLLTENVDAIGNLESYEYDVDEYGNIKMAESGEVPQYFVKERVNLGGKIESKLKTLKIDSCYYDESSTRGGEFILKKFEEEDGKPGFIAENESSSFGSQFFKFTLFSGRTSVSRFYTKAKEWIWDGNNWNGGSIVENENYAVCNEFPEHWDGRYYNIYQIQSIGNEEDVDSSEPEIPVETGGHIGDTVTTQVDCEDVEYEYWTYLVAEKCDEVSLVLDTKFAYPNRNYYRCASLLESASMLITNASQVGDYYYFLIRYENGLKYPSFDCENFEFTGEIVLGDYPYTVNLAKNISGDGNNADLVTEISETDDTVTFKYVIGANAEIDYFGVVTSHDGGIEYEETYGLDRNYSYDELKIDGVGKVKAVYNRIMYDDLAIESENDKFDGKRMTNVCENTVITSNDVWDEENSVNLPVFKGNDFQNLVFKPMFTSNVEFNRGNASAFERHFKLMECNTLEDLEKYQNNIFNI